MGTLRVFEAFAGYGSQSMALKRLAVDYEVVGISEIDKYAIQAYNAVHGDTRNYGDICKIDWKSVPDFDLFTYSFPCQDISSAGKQRGFEEGSGTRSSLLWECKRAIIEKRPKYLLMENVKAITQKKFMPYLETWIDMLSFLGYSSFLKVLNAKDYGVPQNRERAFVVSILGEDEHYEFPSPFELKLKLRDILESNVDESYYISDKTVSRMIRNNGADDFCVDTNGVAKTICSSCFKMTTFDNYVSCAMRGRNPDNPSDRTSGINTEQRIEMGSYIANCITTVQKDSLVAEPRLVGGVGEINFGKQYRQGNRIYDSNGIAMCLMSQPVGNAGGNSYLYKVENMKLQGEYRIRKLTPIECFRLMGVSDSDIDKIQAAGISRTQQYKLAGNSIVVNVLCKIFYEMFKDTDYLIDILA